ncbi:MAG: transketolase family protein [Anaerolineae bacterium]
MTIDFNIVAIDKVTERRATRYAYADAIIEVGEDMPDVVVLDADVAKSIKTTAFAARFPERSFNFGIAEQNMMAAAAGMSTCGLIPFASTYAVFASMRACEQVRTICYSRLNVKIAASHGGITPGPDGVSHQGQEDMGIMRSFPHMTVIMPADSAVVKKAVRAAAEWQGPVYLRFTREPVPTIFDDSYPFEIGKSVMVREGSDVTIIAIGDMVAYSLQAADILTQEGIEARVIDMHTLKPLDEEAVLKAAEEAGAIVTAENHVIATGLGSAVAEVLVENNPVPMKRIGIRDTFAESGPYPVLMKKYGMSEEHIVEAVEDVLARRNGKR